MEWKAAAGQMAEEWAIRRLALLYARAVDRNQPEIFDEIFTEDASIEILGPLSPGRSPVREGRAELKQMPGWAKNAFLGTLHKIHNQLVTVHGDSAEAEVYCTAEHLEKDRGGGATLFTMSIRYLDRLVKHGGHWRFKHRQLVVEWTDVRQVTRPAGAK